MELILYGHTKDYLSNFILNFRTAVGRSFSLDFLRFDESLNSALLLLPIESIDYQSHTWKNSPKINQKEVLESSMTKVGEHCCSLRELGTGRTTLLRICTAVVMIVLYYGSPISVSTCPETMDENVHF